MGLNTAQIQAANHFKAPCMVIAGPGSGKTHTLINRVCNLIDKYHVKPESILVLTYTNAAAEAMRQRFLTRKTAVEKNGIEGNVTFGTFHAVCFHILKTHYHLQKSSLLSEKEKYIILNPILKQRNLSPEAAEEILHCISMQKNGLHTECLSVLPEITTEAFAEITKAYAEKKIEQGKIDFDDMVYSCKELLSQKPEVLKKWQERFAFLLVDEFQDCNLLQYEVLKLLSGPEKNIFVVGDDDQSIYGFRGAQPGIMQQFMADYPEARTIRLEANYRSHKDIISAAGKVIAKNGDRFFKEIYAAGDVAGCGGAKPVAVRSFTDKNEQFSYLAERLKALNNHFPYKEMAVIFRKNREVQELLPFLDKENVPYTVKGAVKGKYEHFTLKDLTAYLQLAIGNTDRYNLLQIMNKPNRGIERLWLPHTQFSWDDLKREALNCGAIRAAEAVELLNRQCIQAGKMSPYLAINWMRKVVGYEKYLAKKAGKNRELLADWLGFLDEVQGEARNFGCIMDWIKFVEGQVQGREADTKKAENGVQLMTMHTSKGLEFSYVCIPNVNQGNIPHGKMPDTRTIQEERRLFYVAMTRAKTALEILYLTGTKEHPRPPSIFLNELREYREASADYSSLTSSSNS